MNINSKKRLDKLKKERELLMINISDVSYKNQYLLLESIRDINEKINQLEILLIGDFIKNELSLNRF